MGGGKGRACCAGAWVVQVRQVCESGPEGGQRVRAAEELAPCASVMSPDQRRLSST